jgi:hypothetical protein
VEPSRSEIILHSLEYLAHATQAEPEGATFAAYTHGLEPFDTATISEACLRLGASEKRFPSLVVVRDMCREILRVEGSQQDAAYRTEVASAYQPVSQSRARLWIDHLRATIDAMKQHKPLPPKPDVLDSTDPRTFHRCHACRDTEWVEHRCPGGVNRTCGRTTHARFISVGKTSHFEASCRVSHMFLTRCSCALVDGPRRA